MTQPNTVPTTTGQPQAMYEAPPGFVNLFYGLLAVWSAVCLVLLHTVLRGLGLSPLYGLLMIVFILVYMWYFSLAFSYRIEVWEDGTFRLTSYRRTLTLKAQDIPKVLGPRFPVGFVKFRLEREMGYLFYQANNEALQKVLSVIRSANPEMHFVNI